MDIVIVGFRVAEENSVFYKKLKDLNLTTPIGEQNLLDNMEKAVRVSDFISVRVVRGPAP